MKYDGLRVRWSKREQDFLVSYPRKCDGGLAIGLFCNKQQRFDYATRQVVFDPSFVDELEARGYDTKTLQFSVKLRARGEEERHGE